MSTSFYIFFIQNEIFFEKSWLFCGQLHSIVYDRIWILVLIHRTMKKIVQKTIHQYIKHHKHHQIVSFIFAIFYDIKLLFMILWSHMWNKFRFFLNMSDICEFFTHINFFKSFVDVSIFVSSKSRLNFRLNNSTIQLLLHLHIAL